MADDQPFFRFSRDGHSLAATEIGCTAWLCDDMKISTGPAQLHAFGNAAHATIPVNLGALGDVLVVLDLDQLLDWADQVREARQQVIA